LAYTGYISAKWLGNPARDVPPWRDTGVVVRGPAVAAINGREIVVDERIIGVARYAANGDVITRTAAPRIRPSRKSRTASFAACSGYGVVEVCIPARRATGKNVAASCRVTAATETS